MRQQVGDVENGVVGFVADGDIDPLAVALEDNAIDGQRKRVPLVFLDAAVVVRVDVGDGIILADGVRLGVKARRVDMGTDHDETFLQGLLANLRQEERLPMAGTIDLRSRLQKLAFWNLVQVLETSGNSHLQASVMGEALCLGKGDEIDVFTAIGVQFRKFLLAELVPALLPLPDFHTLFLLVLFLWCHGDFFLFEVMWIIAEKTLFRGPRGWLPTTPELTPDGTGETGATVK